MNAGSGELPGCSGISPIAADEAAAADVVVAAAIGGWVAFSSRMRGRGKKGRGARKAGRDTGGGLALHAATAARIATSLKYKNE